MKTIGEAVAMILFTWFLGIVLTSIVYAIGSRKIKSEDPHPYCHWKPKRTITAIYWGIEYIPRKTTCLLWEPWNIPDYKKPGNI